LRSKAPLRRARKARVSRDFQKCLELIEVHRWMLGTSVALEKSAAF
jgi:hypothetical protein